MKAHPTTYGGVNFRSRLEAKWAAFFDLLGWQWQYEPIDLDGWTPDFSIQGHDGPIYVEVKPIEWVGSLENNVKQARDREDLKKVFRSKTDRERLILGTAPCFLTNPEASTENHHDANFGLLYGKMGYPLEMGDLDGAVIYFDQPGKYEIAASWGSWKYRISGRWDGKNHLRPVSLTWKKHKWQDACNAVQWKRAA